MFRSAHTPVSDYFLFHHFSRAPPNLSPCSHWLTSRPSVKPPESYTPATGAPSPPCLPPTMWYSNTDCRAFTLLAVCRQGILIRRRVDLHDWVLSAIAASGSSTGGSAAGSGSGGGGLLHPSFLRVVCLYAEACVAPPFGPGPGAATTTTFLMTAILPAEVTEIVQGVQWVSFFWRVNACFCFFSSWVLSLCCCRAVSVFCLFC